MPKPVPPIIIDLVQGNRFICIKPSKYHQIPKVKPEAKIRPKAYRKKGFQTWSNKSLAGKLAAQSNIEDIQKRLEYIFGM